MLISLVFLLLVQQKYRIKDVNHSEILSLCSSLCAQAAECFCSLTWAQLVNCPWRLVHLNFIIVHTDRFMLDSCGLRGAAAVFSWVRLFFSGCQRTSHLTAHLSGWGRRMFFLDRLSRLCPGWNRCVNPKTYVLCWTFLLHLSAFCCFSAPSPKCASIPYLCIPI